jgi:outer membrane protein, multidrug efflux system
MISCDSRSTVGKEYGLFSGAMRRVEARRQAWRCLAVALLSVAWLSGCAMGPDYKRPKVEMAPGWRVDLKSAEGMANVAWWEKFQDPTLNRLIKQALRENKDLLMASARIEAAMASLRQTKADYYPRLDYGATAFRRKESEARTYPYGVVLDSEHSVYQGFLSASWELDLWGRVRRASEAAKAQMLASEEGCNGVILTLVSAVTSSYIELLSLDERIKIARETVASRKQWLRVFQDKKAGGQISELEMSQVKSLYEQAVTRVPALEIDAAKLENALSVLLGRNPGSIQRVDTLDKLAMPEVPQGLPSDLLVRRPDIRQSEQELIAANAKIGVARTLYFPSISLTGLFGNASSEIEDLLKGPANYWEVSGGFLGPLFAGGRITAEVRRNEAVYKELVNKYLRTIQVALQEVNDALVSVQKLRELLQTQKRLVKTLKDYAHYARESYNNGFTNYLTVMDAENKLFSFETQYAQARGELLVAMVGTYKAMGGGWITQADNVRKANGSEKSSKKR